MTELERNQSIGNSTAANSLVRLSEGEGSEELNDDWDIPLFGDFEFSFEEVDDRCPLLESCVVDSDAGGIPTEARPILHGESARGMAEIALHVLLIPFLMLHVSLGELECFDELRIHPGGIDHGIVQCGEHQLQHAPTAGSVIFRTFVEHDDMAGELFLKFGELLPKEEIFGAGARALRKGAIINEEGLARMNVLLLAE